MLYHLRSQWDQVLRKDNNELFSGAIKEEAGEEDSNSWGFE